MARILVVTGLERERGVHQIQIGSVDPEPVQAGLERRFDAFRAMVVVPELCRHEEILATHGPGGEQLFQRGADLRFIAVPLGGVEVAKPDLDRCLDGTVRLGVVGQRRPEPERRNFTDTVVQDKLVLIQIFIWCHGFSPHSFIGTGHKWRRRLLTRHRVRLQPRRQRAWRRRGSPGRQRGSTAERNARSSAALLDVSSGSGTTRCI